MNQVSRVKELEKQKSHKCRRLLVYYEGKGKPYPEYQAEDVVLRVVYDKARGTSE